MPDSFGSEPHSEGKIGDANYGSKKDDFFKVKRNGKVVIIQSFNGTEPENQYKKYKVGL